MIFGTGVDLLEIGRMERLLSRHTALCRIYGPEELCFLQSRGSAETYAGAFCAKEAFAKALGTGIRGFALREVQVLHDGAGKPYFYLTGAACREAETRGLVFHLSITHTAAYAAAFVIAERRDTP